MTRVPLSPSHASADPAATVAEQFALDVSYYLTLRPRQLPSRYLYDALGSTLFDGICRLPWYRVTRAEQRLLAAHGADALRAVEPIATIVELGSGSGEKLRMLLEQCGQCPAVHLIDVSAAALETARRTIESAADVRVTTHQARYEEGLEGIGSPIDQERRTLVLFLGSNIGNYDPPGANALLRAIRSRLSAGDALLLGADLVKPARDLLLAYDDPLGVTSAFNRNLLVRINRELGGNFDVAQFMHRAVWNEPESRVEMHLVARSAQEVHVSVAGIAFTMEAGEWIWTESSYKYRPDALMRLLKAAHFCVARQWIDQRAQFALTLAQAV
jgi:dimethylhistidine N-methyltransferase